jgi:hypothetical protein
MADEPLSSLGLVQAGKAAEFLMDMKVGGERGVGGWVGEGGWGRGKAAEFLMDMKVGGGVGV